MKTGGATLLLIALGLAACPARSPQREEGVAGFFPLAPGNYWRYELDGALGERELEFRIVSAEPGSRGEVRFLVEGRDEGEYHFYRRGNQVGVSPAEGLWSVYLDGDLKVGDTWPGGLVDDSQPGPAHQVVPEGETRPPAKMVPEASSGTKSVTRNDVTLTTPAGRFSRCLKVEHRRGRRLYGVKYFAPGVGLIRSELWALQDGKPKQLVGSQTLVEYHIAERSEGQE